MTIFTASQAADDRLEWLALWRLLADTHILDNKKLVMR